MVLERLDVARADVLADFELVAIEVLEDDADALPQVISELRARGYSFVTLGALTD